MLENIQTLFLTLFLKPNPTVTYAGMARTAHTGTSLNGKKYILTCNLMRDLDLKCYFLELFHFVLEKDRILRMDLKRRF